MIIETVSLFPKINSELEKLLNSMSFEDWNLKTKFPNWTVKDIVAHLLDTSIRKLSTEKYNYEPSINTKIESYEDLVVYITNLADTWVNSYQRVSPEILMKMVITYQNELVNFLKTIDLFKKSKNSVAWAGEKESYNWFDIAREYTERWHHQMQIRETIQQTDVLYEKELYKPVLDTFLKALPYHYGKYSTKKDINFELTVIGSYINDKWIYNTEEGKDNIWTKVTIKDTDVWKVLTKWEKNTSNIEYNIEGNLELGQHFFKMMCIMI